MKKIFLLLFSTLIYGLGFSQSKSSDSLNVEVLNSLLGKWEGTFTIYDQYLTKEYPINLRFVANKDNSYKVYSYSLGHDSGIVCTLDYKLKNRNLIYLEEKQILNSNIDTTFYCLQKMNLRIKKQR